MKRERPEEREVAAAARRAFARGPFSAKEVATPDISADWIGKWGRGTQPRIWELRQLLPELLRTDPEAALVFLDDVLGLRAAGVIVAMAPRAEGAPNDLVLEAAQAGAAVGAVQEAVLEAGRDGEISATDSQHIRTHVRRAERELAEVAAVAARVEAHSQLGLVGE